MTPLSYASASGGDDNKPSSFRKPQGAFRPVDVKQECEVKIVGNDDVWQTMLGFLNWKLLADSRGSARIYAFIFGAPL